jgi:3-oxoacyl-[acyl-carrier protein] reductase
MTQSSKRIAVVTGAAGLIGAQICAALIAEGTHVLAVDVEPCTVPGVELLLGDVANAETIKQMATRVATSHGHVDWFIHAAAVTGRTGGRDRSGALADIELEVWNEALSVNLTSALICVQRFLPLLRSSADPRILLIGSIQGLIPTLGSGAYAVSKSALVGFTRQLAAELAGEGILVNMIAPGPIADADEAQRLRASAMEDVTPLKRFGSPQEVALAVTSVMHDVFGYMTGVVIPLDGGEHLRPRSGPKRPHATRTDI